MLLPKSPLQVLKQEYESAQNSCRKSVATPSTSESEDQPPLSTGKAYYGTRAPRTVATSVRQRLQDQFDVLPVPSATPPPATMAHYGSPPGSYSLGGELNPPHSPAPQSPSLSAQQHPHSHPLRFTPGGSLGGDDSPQPPSPPSVSKPPPSVYQPAPAQQQAQQAQQYGEAPPMQPMYPGAPSPYAAAAANGDPAYGYLEHTNPLYGNSPSPDSVSPPLPHMAAGSAGQAQHGGRPPPHPIRRMDLENAGSMAQVRLTTESSGFSFQSRPSPDSSAVFTGQQHQQAQQEQLAPSFSSLVPRPPQRGQQGGSWSGSPARTPMQPLSPPHPSSVAGEDAAPEAVAFSVPTNRYGGTSLMDAGPQSSIDALSPRPQAVFQSPREAMAYTPSGGSLHRHGSGASAAGAAGDAWQPGPLTVFEQRQHQDRADSAGSGHAAQAGAEHGSAWNAGQQAAEAAGGEWNAEGGGEAWSAEAGGGYAAEYGSHAEGIAAGGGHYGAAQGWEEGGAEQHQQHWQETPGWAGSGQGAEQYGGEQYGSGSMPTPPPPISWMTPGTGLAYATPGGQPTMAHLPPPPGAAESPLHAQYAKVLAPQAPTPPTIPTNLPLRTKSAAGGAAAAGGESVYSARSARQASFTPSSAPPEQAEQPPPPVPLPEGPPSAAAAALPASGPPSAAAPAPPRFGVPGFPKPSYVPAKEAGQQGEGEGAALPPPTMGAPFASQPQPSFGAPPTTSFGGKPAFMPAAPLFTPQAPASPGAAGGVPSPPAAGLTPVDRAAAAQAALDPIKVKAPYTPMSTAAPASQPQQQRRRRQRGGVFSGLLPLLMLAGLLAAFIHPELAVCGITAAATAVHHTGSKAAAALSGVQWHEVPAQFMDSARTLPPHLAAWLRSSGSKLACLGAGGASAGCGAHSSDVQQALYMPRHAHAVASGAPLTGLLAGWGPVWDWARGRQQVLSAHIAALSAEEWERTLRSVNCDSMQPGCSLKRGAMHQLRTGWALVVSAGNAALGHARSGSVAAGSLAREWKEHAPEARAWLQQRAGAAKQLAADGAQWAACVAQRLRAGGSPALRSPAQPVAECWLQHMGHYLEAAAALKAAGAPLAAESAVLPPPVPETAGAEPVPSDELAAAAPEPALAPAPILEPPAAAPEQVPEPAILPPPPVPQPAAVEPAAVAPEQAPEPATLAPPPVPQPVAVEPEQAPEPAVADAVPETPLPPVPQPQAAADGEWVAPVIEQEEDGWVAPVIEQEEGWVAPVIEDEAAPAPGQQQVDNGWSAPLIVEEEGAQGVVEHPAEPGLPAEPAVVPPPEQPEAELPQQQPVEEDSGWSAPVIIDEAEQVPQPPAPAPAEPAVAPPDAAMPVEQAPPADAAPEVPAAPVEEQLAAGDALVPPPEQQLVGSEEELEQPAAAQDAKVLPPLPVQPEPSAEQEPLPVPIPEQPGQQQQQQQQEVGEAPVAAVQPPAAAEEAAAPTLAGPPVVPPAQEAPQVQPPPVPAPQQQQEQQPAPAAAPAAAPLVDAALGQLQALKGQLEAQLGPNAVPVAVAGAAVAATTLALLAKRLAGRASGAAAGADGEGAAAGRQAEQQLLGGGAPAAVAATAVVEEYQGSPDSVRQQAPSGSARGRQRSGVRVATLTVVEEEVRGPAAGLGMGGEGLEGEEAPTPSHSMATRSRTRSILTSLLGGKKAEEGEEVDQVLREESGAGPSTSARRRAPRRSMATATLGTVPEDGEVADSPAAARRRAAARVAAEEEEERHSQGRSRGSGRAARSRHVEEDGADEQSTPRAGRPSSSRRTSSRLRPAE